MLNHGYLPRIYEASRPQRMLDAYVADYLKDEVAAARLVRNLPTSNEAQRDSIAAAALRLPRAALRSRPARYALFDVAAL